MVMIIAHHFAVHGELDYHSDLTVNTVWLQLLQMGGKIGVNLFVLISGYFMANSGNKRISKALKLWAQVFFYSVLFYAVMSMYRAVLLHNFEFSEMDLVSRLFPISFNQWWFASTYFAMLILSPFVNIVLQKLDKVGYLKLLIIMFIMFCLIPSVFWIDYQMSNLAWFIFLYCLAGYIRVYGVKTSLNNKKLLLFATLSYIALFGINIILVYFKNYIPILKLYSDRLFAMNQLLVLIVSILIFVFFKNIRIEKNRMINILAAATFGVYLIHDDKNIRQMLTNHIYGRLDVNSGLLIPYSILVILLIFVICTGMELLRKYLLEKLYLKRLDKLGDTLEVWINKKIQKICDR